MRERITTTLAKAKELKNFIDQLVNKGKLAQANKDRRAALIRLIRTNLSMEATTKITSDFATRFASRKSGYSRVVKLDRRKGDGAEMAVIELVLDPVKEEKKKEKKVAETTK